MEDEGWFEEGFPKDDDFLQCVADSIVILVGDDCSTEEIFVMYDNLLGEVAESAITFVHFKQRDLKSRDLPCLRFWDVEIAVDFCVCITGSSFNGAE